MQHNTTLEDSFVFLTNLSILFPYSPAIVLVSIYPKELKTYVHKNNLYTNVCGKRTHNCENLEAAKWSFSRSMEKLLYIQIIKYQSVLQSNEQWSHERHGEILNEYY